MATALAPSFASSRDEARRRELEQIYDQLREARPKDKVEIIHDRVVVSFVPERIHEVIIFRLMQLLMDVTTKRGWFFSGAISVFLGAQRDRYRPDHSVMPLDAPTWGADHAYGDATVLVVEVVSKSSVYDDHKVKPKSYAAARVPLCMVIDCFAGTVRLLSKPNAQTERYELQHEVPIGKAIELPEPWHLTLDTGKLVD